MTRHRFLGAVAAACVLAAVAGCGGRGGDERGAGDAGRTVARTPRTTTAPLERAPSLLMIGDSLSVGTEQFLPRDLPGWRVEQHVMGGEITGVGMQVWREHAEPVTVSAFSLFTNDDPRNLEAFEDVLRESVERPNFSRCAVWATIHHPGRDGATFDAANALLRRLADEYAGRLLLVPWDETVTKHPELLAPDGVHAVTEGYEVRARLYAEAARRCVG